MAGFARENGRARYENGKDLRSAAARTRILIERKYRDQRDLHVARYGRTLGTARVFHERRFPPSHERAIHTAEQPWAILEHVPLETAHPRVDVLGFEQTWQV